MATARVADPFAAGDGRAIAPAWQGWPGAAGHRRLRHQAGRGRPL